MVAGGTFATPPMANKPPQIPKDPMADTVDRLLSKLPGADPTLGRDGWKGAGAGAPHATFIEPDERAREATRRDKMFVWARVALAVAIGGAITVWPYARECGAPLLGFAFALSVVPAAGAWASITAWRWRIPAAHFFGLAVVLWGAAMWANLILPRVGYARATAGWRCVAPPPPPMVDRTGVVGQPDGTLLYTREVGSTNPSILFPSAGVLDESLRDLGEQAHVIFYDPRHLGRSRAAGVSWGLATDVEDLAAVRWSFVVRDALLMDSLFLVGWSYMGSVVTQYAFENPDQVSGIVLLGSIGPTRSGHRIDWTRGAGEDSLGLELLRITQARGGDRADPVAYCRLMWEVAILYPRMSDPTVLSETDIDVCRVVTQQYLDWELNYDRSIASLGNWDFTASARRYAGRVLVIHGRDDPIPIESAATWALAFPNARLLTIDNAGHLPWLEQPDLVKQAIRSFVAGQWPENAVQVTLPR